MDNHLAAAWCWMQECDADTRYNFMHIDRHNDLGTNTPFDIYRHIKDNQHLSIDEYTNLSWTNEGNGIVVILLLRYVTPLCIMNILTLFNIVLLASCLYKFSKLESLARSVFR